MKRIVLAVSLAGLVFVAAILAQTKTESVEQELIGLENKWVEAVIKHEWGSIEKLQADEFVMTYDGSLFTKAEFLGIAKSRKEQIISWEVDEWKVLVYGDAAVVMGRNTVKIQLEDKEMTDLNRFTDTWVKRDGRWQCVAAHNSTITQQ